MSRSLYPKAGRLKNEGNRRMISLTDMRQRSNDPVVNTTTMMTYSVAVNPVESPKSQSNVIVNPKVPTVVIAHATNIY